MTRHQPRLLLEGLQLVGCSCGWTAPIGLDDSEAALTWHIASALILETSRETSNELSTDSGPRPITPADVEAWWSNPANTYTPPRKHDDKPHPHLRLLALQQALAGRAVAWVIADRACDDRSTRLTHVEREVDQHLRRGQAPSDIDHALLLKLEGARSGLQLASRYEESCNEKFRAAAKKLVAELERDTDLASACGAGTSVL